MSTFSHDCSYKFVWTAGHNTCMILLLYTSLVDPVCPHVKWASVSSLAHLHLVSTETPVWQHPTKFTQVTQSLCFSFTIILDFPSSDRARNKETKRSADQKERNPVCKRSVCVYVFPLLTFCWWEEFTTQICSIDWHRHSSNSLNIIQESNIRQLI